MSAKTTDEVYAHGAPANFLCNVCEHLTVIFQGCWISWGGPTSWPPCSPDFNPLDFCLLGHLKTLIYATIVNNVQTLQDRVFNACKHLQQPGVFQRVCYSFRRRADECIAMEGCRVEHLL